MPTTDIPRDTFDAEQPWPKPDRSDCEFYHSMDFPDGESVTGPWDIRGRFDEYIGNYPVRGKTVLDVGTASGFLAFSAEAEGAYVTAIDLDHIREIDLLPFQGHSYYSGDRLTWEAETQESWARKKKAFWYAWYQNNSNVEVIYAPLGRLRYTSRRFDIVFAGAILEHLGDPVSAIGLIGRVAKEAVVIAFTPVEDTEELLIRPISDLTNPANYFTWWSMSRGLYRRIFRNIGFEIEVVPSRAVNTSIGIEVERPTIIARRSGKIPEVGHVIRRGKRTPLEG
jgi:2-polyprenyl-3-methyl-5-hydroxy-6-metoxy-1,4-benzoquinol methylase